MRSTLSDTLPYILIFLIRDRFTESGFDQRAIRTKAKGDCIRPLAFQATAAAVASAAFTPAC